MTPVTGVMGINRFHDRNCIPEEKWEISKCTEPRSAELSMIAQKFGQKVQTQ